MINKKTNFKKTDREWADFWFKWHQLSGWLITCKSCGYDDNSKHDPLFTTLVSSSFKYSKDVRCGRCDASMPWLNERTYGIPENELRSTRLNNNWGLRDLSQKRYWLIDPDISIWTFKK